jgi:hypothetical protein
MRKPPRVQPRKCPACNRTGFPNVMQPAQPGPQNLSPRKPTQRKAHRSRSRACPPTNSRYVRHHGRALAEQLFEPPRRNRGAKQKSLHLGAA